MAAPRSVAALRAEGRPESAMAIAGSCSRSTFLESNWLELGVMVPDPGLTLNLLEVMGRGMP